MGGRFSRYIPNLVLGIAIGCALYFLWVWVDPWFQGQLFATEMPGDLKTALECLGYLGHGFGVAIAALVVWQLDSKQSAYVVVIAAFMAGVSATAIKVIVCRPRPFVPASEWNGVLTWNQAIFEDSLQSFPSGHSSTAFGLFVTLALMYPKGRILFLILATSVGIQRIISSNHFPSDVLAGALLGWAAAKVAIRIGRRTTFPDGNATIPASRSQYC